MSVLSSQRRRLLLVAVLIIVAGVAALIFRGRWTEAAQPAPHAYAGAAPAACPFEVSPDQKDADRLPHYTVRTPANYDARRPHPLLVVYSPAGLGRGMTEFFTGLTPPATAAGIVVAYVDSRPLSRTAVEAFARVPRQIAAGWCIDPARITLTGHSDGGTIAEAVALLPTAGTLPPAAVAASAAGIQGSDFSGFHCPVRADVMLVHGSKDTHFPGYGATAASGWARCMGCRGETSRDADGCVVYRDCSGQLRYCETDGGHLQWPAINDRVVAQALRARRD